MNILLVDDHAVTRETVASLLEEEAGLSVVAQAANGEEGVMLAERLHPDLVLMDIAMPRMNGIEATRRILASRPDARVLVLSNHDERGLVSAAFEAGAAGYLRKDRAYEELVPAIRTVATGKRYPQDNTDR